jgi:nucleotide-binding universal stress UspA family protein
MARPSTATPTRRPVPRPRAAVPTTRARRVITGTDGSYWGRVALRWAAEHAWRIGAELEVHAAPVDPARADLRDDGLGQTASAFPMLPIRVRTSATATPALVAASVLGDLVVLGCRGTAHGTTGLGSAVLPVIRGAHCDVLVVRGRPDAVRGAYRQVTAFLGAGDDNGVLRAATDLAVARRCALRVQRAVPPAGRVRVTVPADEPVDRLDYAASVVHRAAPHLRTTLHLVRAQPHEAIAACGDTDVLVVDGGTVDGTPDPVVAAALHHAPCPVMAARRGER